MFKKTLFFVLLSSFIISCDSKDSNYTEDENLEIVPPGKADNFYSDVAMEYKISGVTTVTITDDTLTPEAKAEEAESLAEVKITVIMTYLNEYVIDKSEHHSSHPDFGGFHAMARADSFKAANVVVSDDDPNTFKVEFSGEIGGSIEFLDFLENAPNHTPPENGKVIDFGIPNFDSEHLADGSWKWRYQYPSPSKWDPAEHSEDEIEHIFLDITSEEIAKDAYLNYEPLFADGKLTVGIMFGYDYNEAEYDVSEAKELYEKLVAWGFDSPVSSFEDLRIDSDPLTKTVKYDNEDVTIEVKLVYDRMVDPVADAAVLKDMLLDFFRQKEVILFNGHAGFSGRFLPANFMSTSKGNITREEMWQLDMPTSYQIVLVNGCDTFGKFADNFRFNPSKHDENDNLINVDVITTTSFSWLSQWGDVTAYVLKSLSGGYSSRISIYTWDQLLTEINWGVNSTVFFGVHGIDNDPKLHPFANPDSLCNSCKYNSDCGNYYGNKCVKMIDGNKHCTMTCLDDSVCPEGMTCQKVASGYTVKTKQCVPVALQCSSNTSNQDSEIKLMINEVLADPPADNSGDANHDGYRSSIEDEFIEIVNIGSDVDISGYTIADSREVRFTFPEGTIISAGDVILVFGGGNINEYSWADNTHVFKASNGLYLNNSGDSVFFSDNNGKIIDSMSYQSEGGHDKSLTRSTDKDPNASFIPHPVVPHSAGYAQDGSSL